jgi:hypothetical protein
VARLGAVDLEIPHGAMSLKEQLERAAVWFVMWRVCFQPLFFLTIGQFNSFVSSER